MKPRPEGFLSEEHIDHDSEVFDYIRELHGILWKFVKAVAHDKLSSGIPLSLSDLVPVALERLEKRAKP